MKNLQEKKLHGQPDFPFAVYPGRLPEFGSGYPLHWHEEMELICIQSGTGIISVQARQYEVHSGDILVIPPRTVHAIGQLEQEEMAYFNILFRLSLLESLPAVAGYTEILRNSKHIPVFLPVEHPLNRALRPSVLELGQSRKKEHTAYVLMIYAHLYQILYQIARACPEPEGGEKRDNGHPEKIQELLEYLKDHYAREITVQEAASRCGFSESHFMRLFREQTGTSFAQYVKLQRLNKAAQLLRSTGKRISEVAGEVGFHNLSYFTRSFEKKYHMSPSAYREMWKKEI